MKEEYQVWEAGDDCSEGHAGVGGPGDVPPRCPAKFFLFTASVEWRFIVNTSPEKGFCKECVNVLCPEDQNNPQRQQLSHTRSPLPALRRLPLHFRFAFQARSSARPHPHTRLPGQETKGAYPQHRMTISTLSAMVSMERLVTVCGFPFY